MPTQRGKEIENETEQTNQQKRYKQEPERHHRAIHAQAKRLSYLFPYCNRHLITPFITSYQFSLDDSPWLYGCYPTLYAYRGLRENCTRLYQHSVSPVFRLLP